MRDAGYRFRVVPSRVSERTKKGISPRELVRSLAVKKARAISRRFPTDVVLGADTVVFINGNVIGKPKGPAHARAILMELSGAWQKVYTGVAVVWDGGRRTRSRVAVSQVKLRKLDLPDLERASRRHLDKAGAYAVQETNDPFVETIRGDYDNVVGLPMKAVKKLLAGWSVQTLPKRL
jgi:septum formation protein